MRLPSNWERLPERDLFRLRDRVDEIDVDLIDDELSKRAHTAPPLDTPALGPPWWERK